MLNSDNLVFNSIHELIDALDKSKDLHRENSSEKTGGSSWVDTSSYEEARKFMLAGKMYDGLSAEIEKYRTKGTATKRINQLNVVGHNVVVPLYLQGIPTCMMSNKKVINNKIVTIFFSPQAPYYVDQEDLINGASNLFKNIISLESQGYRVNLYVIECQHGYGYCIKLKSDRETLNIKKLCFPLVSSSMLRRIGFRIKERLYKTWIGCGYGSGIFTLREYDEFIKKNLKLRNYEIWNYEGKKK